MPFDKLIPFKAEEDDYVWYYNPETGKFIADGVELSSIPKSIRIQIKEIKEKAQVLPDLKELFL